MYLMVLLQQLFTQIIIYIYNKTNTLYIPLDKNATLKNSHGIHGCTLCVVNFQLDVVGRSDVEWLFLVFIFHHSFYAPFHISLPEFLSQL